MVLPQVGGRVGHCQLYESSFPKGMGFRLFRATQSPVFMRQAASVWQMEILWWIITFLIVALVLLPIYFFVDGYQYYGINIVFIVSFITLTRYLFLLPYTFLAHKEWMKIVLVFLCIPLAFYLVQGIHHFQTFLDEEGQGGLVGRMTTDRQLQWTTYIRSELLLFGVGGTVAAVLLPFRLFLSVWRGRNRGTV